MGLASAYLELTKPRLSALVLATTAIGFWMGMRQVGHGTRFVVTLLGTVLVVGGANALNEWMERDADGLMQRTRHRPLPAKQLTPDAACRFGIVLIVGGVLLLAVAVNLLSAALAVCAAVSYLCVYTPLKPRTSLCTLVGAVPGAIPPLIGWAAARGALGPEAWALFALLFLWQLPHFLAIAVLYRDDYVRAGFKMLSVTAPDGAAAARQTVLYAMALLPASLFPTLLGLSGSVYFHGALCLGLGFALLAVRSALTRSLQTARQLFIASVLYLPLLMALLGFDKVAG